MKLRLVRFWNRLAYRIQVHRELSGRFKRECTICGFSGWFLSNGHPPRYDVRCPKCFSNERHRLLKLILGRHDVVKSSDAVLHFAPEKSLRQEINHLAGTYHTADITPGRADTIINIEEPDIEDECYDVVICNHVLEHVDDTKALAQLFRILRHGGRLIAMFPIIEGWDETYENDSIHCEKERVLHFGQEDHVRFYGNDVRDRIRGAGFSLTEYTSVEPDVMRYGLQRGEKVFVGLKK